MNSLQDFRVVETADRKAETVNMSEFESSLAKFLVDQQVDEVRVRRERFMKGRRILRKLEDVLDTIGFSKPSRIGKGGFGHVYHSENQRTGDEIAVKVYNKEEDPKLFYTTLPKHIFDHPALIQPLHRTTIEDVTVVFMKYNPGKPLNDVFSDCDNYDMDYLADVSWSLYGGLAYLESHGLVHGDIKSHNIIGLQIGDFDTLAENPHISETVTSTPRYFAPETRYFKSSATDVYCATAVMYEGLFGMTPLERALHSRPETATGIMHQSALFDLLKGGIDVSVPAHARLARPDMINEILKAGMAYNPSDRPSAADMQLSWYMALEAEKKAGTPIVHILQPRREAA